MNERPATNVQSIDVRSGVARRVWIQSLALFGVSATMSGIAVSWFTSYVLAPTEKKFLEAPGVPFQISGLFAVVIAIGGSALFGATLGVLANKNAIGPRWKATVAGAAYLLVLYAGADALFRWRLENASSPALFWAAAFVLPPILARMSLSPVSE